MEQEKDISDLIGKIISNIISSDSEILFTMQDGSKYKMYHEQSCCESVYVDDIEGEWKDLIGSPILQAEEPSSEDIPGKDDPESYTWTFYKLATIKGYVTIKFYGSSNGYYSERVSFVKL